MSRPATAPSRPLRRPGAADRGLSGILPVDDGRPDQHGRDDPDAWSTQGVRSSRRTTLRRRPQAVLDELARAANAGCSTEELLARGLSLVLGVTRLPVGIACLCPAGEETPTVVETRGLRPATARVIERAVPLAVPDDMLVAELPRLPAPPATRDLLGADGIRRGVVVPLLSARGPSGALVGLSRGRTAVRAPRTLLRSVTLELGSAVGSTLFRQGLQAANSGLLRLLTLVAAAAEPAV